MPLWFLFSFLYIWVITFSCRSFFSVPYSMGLLETNSSNFIYVKCICLPSCSKDGFAGYKNLDWLLFELFQHIPPISSGFYCFEEKSVFSCIVLMCVLCHLFFAAFQIFFFTFGFSQCVYDVPRCGFLFEYSWNLLSYLDSYPHPLWSFSSAFNYLFLIFLSRFYKCFCERNHLISFYLYLLSSIFFY